MACPRHNDVQVVGPRRTPVFDGSCGFMTLSTASHTVPNAPWIASTDSGQTGYPKALSWESGQREKYGRYKSPWGKSFGISEELREIASELFAAHSLSFLR